MVIGPVPPAAAGLNAVDARRFTVQNNVDLLLAQALAGLRSPSGLAAALRFQALPFLSPLVNLPSILPPYPLLSPLTLQFLITGPVVINIQHTPLPFMSEATPFGMAWPNATLPGKVINLFV